MRRDSSWTVVLKVSLTHTLVANLPETGRTRAIHALQAFQACGAVGVHISACITIALSAACAIVVALPMAIARPVDFPRAHGAISAKVPLRTLHAVDF